MFSVILVFDPDFLFATRPIFYRYLIKILINAPDLIEFLLNQSDTGVKHLIIILIIKQKE